MSSEQGHAEIGLIGLGVMGSSLALNIAEKGFKIAVYNIAAEKTEAFITQAGSLAANIIPCQKIEDLVHAIRPPRPVILMVTAGEAVDSLIAKLRPVLSEQDIIIDAGNANYHDTRRRFAELKDSGLTFIGMGVSGGEEGARHGPSIMVGGTEQSYIRIKDILSAIAARYKGEPCSAYMGTDGAGHFVKMIHNGIEYGDMQMIAEIYGIMRDGMNMTAPQIGKVFEKWNDGRLNSYLVEITASILGITDPVTNKPIVESILDKAGQKGTGKWSAIAAQTLGVPSTVVESAVAARALSALKAERIEMNGLYKGVDHPAFSADPDMFRLLELALFAGKINAYAQGFAVLSEAAKNYNWSLPMAEIARIWREGCIIRSQFLDIIAEAFDREPNLSNILKAPNFVAAMKEALPALRQVVSQVVLCGIPVPALSAALGYFESFRNEQGTANIIQAQRDFFGAHGFERIGEEGIFHGPWGNTSL